MHNNTLKEGESDNKTCAFTCAHGMQENYIYIYIESGSIITIINYLYNKE